MTLNKAIRRIPLYFVVALGAFLTLAPFAWMILSPSRTRRRSSATRRPFCPDTWRMSNYAKLFAERPFGTWYMNSILVAGISTVAVLFFSSLAGFAFAKYEFKGRTLMFALLIGSTMIPFQLILIPLFIETSRMKMINTYAGLIIPFMAPALGIFLMKQYMSAIPNELLDAARIDGAAEFTVFWRIVVPLLRPALATLGIITFLGSWNSFIWPLVMLRSEAMMTLPIGLRALTENVPGKERDYGMIMAAATLVSVPVIIVFIAMQRQFISGLLSGSVKQ